MLTIKYATCFAIGAFIPALILWGFWSVLGFNLERVVHCLVSWFIEDPQNWRDFVPAVVSFAVCTRIGECTAEVFGRNKPNTRPQKGEGASC